jgi:hypothetical protein
MSKLSGTCGPLFEKEEAGDGREKQRDGWRMREKTDLSTI